MAIFTVLLVCLDYVSIFRHWQIYILLAPIINFGSSFVYTLFRYALYVFDGQGGLTIFLFSGVVTLTIWVVSVRGNPEKFKGKKIYKSNDI